MSVIETRTPTLDVSRLMAGIGENARAAAHVLATASAAQKNQALEAMSASLIASTEAILDANAGDLEKARANGINGAFLERLELDAERVKAMADGLRAIAGLADPVGETLKQWDVPSGLRIERVRTPLGVIGIIYESRPNVTADAGALCLKSGNAAILRAGSDSQLSSRRVHQCLVDGLRAAGLPETAIQLIPTTDRQAVGEMLGGLGGNVDVLVPRGGASLVARVQAEARVPVFAHLEGICHVFIDASAEIEMAVRIALNSKMRRTSICGAMETLLIHKDAAPTHLPPIAAALSGVGCELRGDRAVREIISGVIPAKEADWHTEYNEAIVSIALVADLQAAIDHIETYSSHHTEAIVTEDQASVARFFAGVDSAILMHNASTQFADGGEFGMGGEIGIATGKMHARGPVGVEQLTSFKYLVRGNGQVRA